MDLPPLPQQYAAPAVAHAPLLEEWWRRFGSPALAQAVEEALRENHDLKAAAARLDAATAQARIAGADLAPHADLSFDSRRLQQVFVGLPIPGAGGRVLKSRATTHGLTFGASWELDVWGRLRAGQRAALAEWQASEADRRAAQLSLAGQAAKAWMTVTEARRQLSLARATAETYRITAQQARARYERGLRSPLDLRLALANQAAASALAAQREREQQTASRQLEVLLGRYPAGQQEGDPALPEVPAEVPAGLPSALLERRADLAASERRLAASRARVREAKAALFPRIALTASGGRLSSELGDLISSQFNLWTLAGNFAQPLFEGGRLRGQVKLAQARSREAVEGYVSDILRAFGEVENALAAEALLKRREAELAEATQQSQAALRLAEDRYRSGLEEFVTLLEAQRRALDSESQLLAVRRQRLENRVDLHLALGGGFEL